MTMKNSFITLALFVLFVLNVYSQQQQPNGNPPPDMPIDAATKAQIINDLTRELNESYIFADVAKNMETAVKQKLQGKAYDGITGSREFAARLTEDLQAVSKDKHLRVRFSYEKIPARQERREPSKEEIENFQRSARQINFGFEKIERLQGNIGYIDLRGFSDPEGGAHPGGMVRLNDHFGAFIPTGRAINPISKTNWEGTGVEPDVKVPKELALKTAYSMALSKVADKTTDEQRKKSLKELAEKTRKEIEEMKKTAKN
jgi:C-terminal processing protease CtpA/Prc